MVWPGRHRPDSIQVSCSPPDSRLTLLTDLKPTPNVVSFLIQVFCAYDQSCLRQLQYFSGLSGLSPLLPICMTFCPQLSFSTIVFPSLAYYISSLVQWSSQGTNDKQNDPLKTDNLVYFQLLLKCDVNVKNTLKPMCGTSIAEPLLHTVYVLCL